MFMLAHQRKFCSVVTAFKNNFILVLPSFKSAKAKCVSKNNLK